MLPSLHQRQSEQACRAVGFAPNIARLVGRATQWPDFHRKHLIAAHCLTPLDTQNTAHPKEAEQRSLEVAQEYLRKIAVGTAPASTVWLGFLLHLVQDLAAHEGRTREEHAAQLFRFWENPDYSPRRYRQGRIMSEQLLRELLARVDGSLRDAWMTGQGVRPVTDEERIALLGPKDSSIQQALDFVWQGLRALALRPPRIRWDTQKTFSAFLDAVRHADFRRAG